MAQLSEIELTHLNYLGELIDYGTSLLQKEDLYSEDQTHLQKFLIFNHIAIHNYSEAILLLCKNLRPQAASLILRAILEANTNATYLKKGNSERRLALFAKEAAKSRLKIGRGFEGFINKYPARRDTLEILRSDQIKKLQEQSKQHISSIEKANHLNKKDIYPDFFRLCLQVDQEAEEGQKGDAELYYHLVFRYLSPLAHLNADGLGYFIDEKPNGYKKYLFSQTDEVDLVIQQTYLYYFVSLKDLFDSEVLLNIEFDKKYEQYVAEIKKKD